MTTNESSNTTFVFFAALGMVLIVAIILVMLWVQNLSTTGDALNRGAIFSLDSGRRIKLNAPAGEGEGDTAAAPAADESAETTGVSDTNLDAVIAAINRGGCAACHTIPNIPGAVGQVGPNLSNLGAESANRREGYTAEQYIRESILEPNAFIAPECPTGPCPQGVMPQVTLSEEEVDVIVNYLSTLGVSN